MTIGEHFTPDGSPDGTALEAFPDNSGYAVVDCGDGTSSTCQFGVVPPPGIDSWCYVQDYNEFSGNVYGWHTYHEQAQDTHHSSAWTITISEYDSQDNLQSVDYGSANVADAPLSSSEHDGEHARGRWRPAARSLGYRVTIRLTGSPRPVSVITGKRSLSFTVTSSRVGVTATVQGEGGFGVLGRAASARLRAGRRGGPAHHRRSKHHRRK